ncbi:MAG: YibE/F family protein [Candidatus Nomurabacteria bacterium]|nr:YibE/F family protein [Candidatus Nomurabacteria bacterium]
MHKFIKILFIFIVIFSFSNIYASDNSQDNPETFKAKAISVEKIKDTPAQDNISGIPQEAQKIKAEIVSGNDKGKIIELDNDYTMISKGDRFFAYYSTDDNTYHFDEPDRLPSIIFFTILFLVILFLFGGIQGVRGLASLIGSLALIIYVLIPSILGGYSPILISLFVSSVIIIVGSFITHGFNKTTLSAVIGMIITVTIAGILASIAVHTSYLSGYSSEESIYLNYNNAGTKIDLAGLLLGGILIGLLGILYDVAIGQAVAVEELLRADPKMNKILLYKRSIRIGREHIGALVNTLAIAYVGASLPLLLLFSTNNNTEAIKFTLNREIFATEIIRTLIGSIGLILAVPITTFITVFILTKAKVLPNSHSGHSH